MSCDCHIISTQEAQRRTLVTLLAINATMFLVELVVGLMAESSGVIADSLDMLADALVFGAGLYAIGKAAAIKRQAAWWSGIFQLLLAVSIVVDVIRRAIFGSEPHSLPMMITALAAFAANVWCLSLLQKHKDGEVHMRASWLFSRSDTIANFGVVVAGLLIWLTASRWPDLIVGASIGLVVVKSGSDILREANRQDLVVSGSAPP